LKRKKRNKKKLKQASKTVESKYSIKRQYLRFYNSAAIFRHHLDGGGKFFRLDAAEVVAVALVLTKLIL
jgi:hypothetical protein